MEDLTLVVSDPPHRDVDEVDLEKLTELLGLDIFVTRLKVKFVAPEILSATHADEAEEFAAALTEAGLTVSVVEGALLTLPPWPDPVSSLALDESGVRATVRGEGVEVPRDTEVLAVYCRPPADFSMKASVDLGQAVVSGHGPTIADAIQWLPNLDLYFNDAGGVRRVSIVPDLLEVDGDELVDELSHRFDHLHLDTRLAGVRPRARFIMGEAGFDPDQRKRYSFGTLLLCHVLESISPELRNIPHYEFGSRLAYALSPLAGESG